LSDFGRPSEKSNRFRAIDGRILDVQPKAPEKFANQAGYCSRRSKASQIAECLSGSPAKSRTGCPVAGMTATILKYGGDGDED